MYWHDSGHMFGIGGIWMLIFWVIATVWVLWLINTMVSRPSNNRESQLSPYQPAENIVKERYARGEISREEFQNLMQELKQ